MSSGFKHCAPQDNDAPSAPLTAPVAGHTSRTRESNGFILCDCDKCREQEEEQRARKFTLDSLTEYRKL